MARIFSPKALRKHALSHPNARGCLPWHPRFAKNRWQRSLAYSIFKNSGIPVRLTYRWDFFTFYITMENYGRFHERHKIGAHIVP